MRKTNKPILVGESLMREADLGAAVDRLLGKVWAGWKSSDHFLIIK